MSINQVCEACGNHWFDPQSAQVDLCPKCEDRAEAAIQLAGESTYGYSGPPGIDNRVRLTFDEIARF